VSFFQKAAILLNLTTFQKICSKMTGILLFIKFFVDLIPIIKELIKTK